MARLEVRIDAESILNLLTQYSDGDVPLDATLLSVGISARLGRWIGLLVNSEQWRDWREAERTADGGLKPLHVRYEGKKVMVFGDPAQGGTPEWREGVEAPKR